jgi:hypothetical protein
VEDILYYNRLLGMLQNFRTANAVASEGVMGVGTGTNALTMTSPGPEQLEPGETRTIVCDLPCGLLNSDYRST